MDLVSLTAKAKMKLEQEVILDLPEKYKQFFVLKDAALEVDTQQLEGLLPKQRELYDLVRGAKYSWIGYGGSRGGAKSHGIREIALDIADKISGIKQAIFRRLKDDLLENHIIPMLEKHPELRDYWNWETFQLSLPNGSIIFFNYAQYEKDIYSYHGKEYDIIYVDEATHFTQVMLQFLKTCNRSPKQLIKAKMVLTMNPGNVGHVFVKRIFIDQVYQDNEAAEDYVYLQAKVQDNVVWVLRQLIADGLSIDIYYNVWTDEQRLDYVLKYSDYAKDLSHLPEELKKAHLYGDWDVFGGLFFKVFSKKMLILGFMIPKEWKLIGSLDPGWESPCSFSLSAYDFDGNKHRLGTYYEREKAPYQHAEDIKEWIRRCPYTQDNTLVNLPPGMRGRMPSMITAGRDAFARKDRFAIVAHSKTWEDVFSDVGLYLTRAITDRKHGWGAMKDMMHRGMYFIFGKEETDKRGNKTIVPGDNSPLVEFLTSVISDPKKVDDIFGKGDDPSIEDHAGDEDRYNVMAGYKAAERKKEEVKSDMRDAVKRAQRKRKGLADF